MSTATIDPAVLANVEEILNKASATTQKAGIVKLDSNDDVDLNRITHVCEYEPTTMYYYDRPGVYLKEPREKATTQTGSELIRDATSSGYIVWKMFAMPETTGGDKRYVLKVIMVKMAEN
jgi:hypothetical protein